MLLTDHKTHAIFDRYNIIHEQELLEAAAPPAAGPRRQAPRNQMLATAAGAGNRTWRAYLSATVAGGRGAPPQAAVDENGDEVNGVGDQPNMHDILTGSDSMGRAATGAATVVTCNNWTSNAETDRTIVGHHDRLGGGSASWNATHSSAGCSQENLVQTGGNGLFYCFATD